MLFSLVVTYTMILAHRHMENISEILPNSLPAASPSAREPPSDPRSTQALLRVQLQRDVGAGPAGWTLSTMPSGFINPMDPKAARMEHQSAFKQTQDWEPPGLQAQHYSLKKSQAMK